MKELSTVLHLRDRVEILQIRMFHLVFRKYQHIGYGIRSLCFQLLSMIYLLFKTSIPLIYLQNFIKYGIATCARL